MKRNVLSCRAPVIAGWAAFALLVLWAGVSNAVQVSVRVVTSGGLDPSGLLVQACAPSGEYAGPSGVTGADGVALLRGLAARRYRFRVKVLGSWYWSSIVHVPVRTGTVVELFTGGGRLVVAVDQGGGTPLEGASCALYSAGGTSLGRGGRTDARGQVAFSVPSARYKVRCSRLGFPFWTPSVAVASDARVALSIPHRDVSVVVQGVYRGSAEPRAGVPCSLFTQGGVNAGETRTTDESGRASFRVPRKSYRVRADFLGSPRWSVPATWEDHWIRVGEGVAEVSVSRGWEEAPGVPVEVFRGGGVYPVVVGTTDSDGVERFRLPPGGYRFRAEVEGEHVWSRSVAVAENRRVAVRLEVPTLGEPPRIVNQPQSVTVNEGDGAVFSIAASGSQLSFQWYCDGVPVAGARASAYALAGISYARNGSRFSCVVTNPGGRAASAEARLTVTDRTPPELVVEGAARLTVTRAVHVLLGTAADRGVGLGEVRAVSDRFPGRGFAAAVSPQGAFAIELPLTGGENRVTVVALDRSGNETRRDVVVVCEVSTVLVVSVRTPSNGATVGRDRVTVAGTVRWPLESTGLRLVLGNQVAVPQGSGGVYSFSFPDVALVEGGNTLTVTAETASGSGSAQVTVYRVSRVPGAQGDVPRIELRSPSRSGSYVKTNSVVVSGFVSGSSSVRAVTVNGRPAAVTGPGVSVSFSSELLFSEAGSDDLEAVVEAELEDGGSSTVRCTVHRDTTAPAVRLDAALAPPPAVNRVVQAPFRLSGTVTEKNLASILVNGQGVGVLPGAGPDEWVFEANLALGRGAPQTAVVETRDWAGNVAVRDVVLQFAAAVGFDVVEPSAEARFPSAAPTLEVGVLARVTGLSAGDEVRVRLDGEPAAVLAVAGSVAQGTLLVSGASGEHGLVLEAFDARGTLLGSTTRTFTVVNAADVPLAVERTEPSAGATGVEPDAALTFAFNRPVDPTRLTVQVAESVHGFAYAAAPAGAGIARLSRVDLAEVHRDQEPVAGVVSLFPEGTLAVFYPERPFAYGAAVSVAVLYDGVETSRAGFHVRPLPTALQGFVSDPLLQPLTGVEVSLPPLGRSVSTDANGGFGFSDGDGSGLPAGRLRVVVNPGSKNPDLATVEQWVSVEQGKLNRVGVMRLPLLNASEPFRLVRSGQTDVRLAAGDLSLDLSRAALLFPDGRDAGSVHAQFVSGNDVPYPAPPGLQPFFAFFLSPAAVEVSGTVAVSFNLPRLYDSYDYLGGVGDKVLLLGLDPEVLHLLPVGVGKVDLVNRRVASVSPVALKRLDIVGCALVGADRREALEAFANGTVSSGQLLGLLQ